MVPASPGVEMEVDNTLDNSLDSDSSSGTEVAVPDLSLEWTDMRVTFRVLNDNGQDGDGVNNKGFAIYPELDPGAPSSRTLLAQRRRQIRAQKEKNPMTLSNLIGGAGGLTSGPPPPPAETAVVSRPPQPQQPPVDVRPAISTPQETSPHSKASVTSVTGNNLAGAAEKPVPVLNKHKLKCHLCNATFKKTTYLKRHILTHTNEKPYKCDICNWGFFQHCNLKRHMISHNVDNGSEGFKCQHCQASFTTKSVLSVHMRDAHGDKLVTKKEQRSSTGTMAAAAAAAAAVAAASPPKASPERASPPAAVAPAAAKLPSPAAAIHAPASAVGGSGGANWSQCHVCHKYFVTEANLKQHMLLHEGRKPFKCNFCGLRFSQKPNLKKHLMTHTPATEGYPCPTCSILFRTREDLAQHILKQHPLDSGGGGVPSGSSSNMDEEEEIPSPMDTDDPVVEQQQPVEKQTAAKPSPALPEPKAPTAAKATPEPKVATPKTAPPKPTASTSRSTPAPAKAPAPAARSATNPSSNPRSTTTPSNPRSATPNNLRSTTTPSNPRSAATPSNPRSATPSNLRSATTPSTLRSATPSNPRSTTPNPRTVTPTTEPLEPKDQEKATEAPASASVVQKVFACAICKATFQKVAQRNRHINDNHSLISPATTKKEEKP